MFFHHDSLDWLFLEVPYWRTNPFIGLLKWRNYQQQLWDHWDTIDSVSVCRSVADLLALFVVSLLTAGHLIWNLTCCGLVNVECKRFTVWNQYCLKLLNKSVFLFVFLKKRTKNVYGVSVSLEIRIVKMFYVNLLLH